VVRLVLGLVIFNLYHEWFCIDGQVSWSIEFVLVCLQTAWFQSKLCM